MKSSATQSKSARQEQAAEPVLLEKAIAIAVEAHRGQQDRYGAPYVLHPLRVMARVEMTAQKTVAVLHDVVEDTR